ncbi:hypothetical protein MRX96_037494 [Rhipicephalus microplus]
MEALRHIKNKGSAVTIPVYTDCLSLLQALSWFRTTDPRIRELKVNRRDISTAASIALFHVSGHAGLFRNELADFLAEHVAQSGDMRQAPPHFEGGPQCLEKAETLALRDLMDGE